MPRAASSLAMKRRSSSRSVRGRRASATWSSTTASSSSHRSPGTLGTGGGICPRATTRTTATSIGRSRPTACSATPTGSSRWRARSTGTGSRSSEATRSAASVATGPASSMSRVPAARRPGHYDRQPRRAGALAPGRGLRAMPLGRPSARGAAGPPGRGFSTRAAVPSVLDGGRAVSGSRRGPSRRSSRADAREPLFPCQRRPARVHLLP